MLNSNPINEAIKSKQPLGAFGEQHIHQLPLSLILDFNPEIPEHVRLAKEAQRIHDIAKTLVQDDPSLLDTSKALSSRRKCFRTKLEPELEKLNSLAESILEVANGR
jgi:hypothetical protein